MSAARPQFSIDDAFELSLEDAGPGPEPSGVARFGPLHFERRARFEVADEDKQSRLRYQNLENDEDGAQASPELDGGVNTRDSTRTSIRSSQWSFSTISSSTQRSYNACCSWIQHPLIQKNRRVVLASFLLLLLGLVLILIGVGLEVSPSPGVSSAIFFVPGFLLLVPGGPPRLPVLLPALLRKVIGGRASARSARPSEPHLTGRTLKTAPLGVGSGSSIGPGKMPRVCSVP
ncbi:transmembrane protein 134 isoform X2 [Loxodonta africana]|uniref:transmembrane protein 134 isoform X1 n=1 Tax=Elephas maximus indicus TaxID=99487 RepID=UPI002115ECEE|nr:transmembrane protein 134 isoform X1 [Elephas maximus indicus]